MKCWWVTFALLAACTGSPSVRAWGRVVSRQQTAPSTVTELILVGDVPVEHQVDRPMRYWLYVQMGPGAPAQVEVSRLQHDLNTEGRDVELAYVPSGCNPGWRLAP